MALAIAVYIVHPHQLARAMGQWRRQTHYFIDGPEKGKRGA
jgi:hypothetical protein